MEPKLEDIILELAPKSSFVTELPLSVDNFKGNVFVWRSYVESQRGKICVISARCEEVLRSYSFLDQIWIEYVEFVALHDFWWRIVNVIMGLVVFVPFESSVYAVKVSGIYSLVTSFNA